MNSPKNLLIKVLLYTLATRNKFHSIDFLVYFYTVDDEIAACQRTVAVALQGIYRDVALSVSQQIY